ncbi:MAG TPA: UDP-N-acetylenolpyruvoylglucosamine reductase [Gammaproteobacteria bacterium]|nr:UDP-N-acetylenolpyruvoylglucosamine reductase [Gammaproteobacteria bacterium]
MQQLRGELLQQEPMGPHCSWRTGGVVKQLFRPADTADLQQFLQQLADDEQLIWVGLGSNLLVRDGGFDGSVILTKGRLQQLEITGDVLSAQAGVSCAKVARESAKQGYCGLEFFAGIPGTIGGALAMNAGAFGGETWENVLKVETIDRHGNIRTRLPEDFKVHYREVSGTVDEYFLRGWFRLQHGDVKKAQQRIRHLLERRAQTQPTTQASCGSTYRNPEGDFAARLIESAGLKGYCIGGACVSEKHANFIINRGDATASDIEQLMGYVQQQVLRKSSVSLQAEVHVVGDAA